MSGGQSGKDKKLRSSCRRYEAAFGGEAVVNSGSTVCQFKSALWFYDRFAIERSLVSSAAATNDRAWPVPANPAVFSVRANARFSAG